VFYIRQQLICNVFGIIPVAVELTRRKRNHESASPRHRKSRERKRIGADHVLAQELRLVPNPDPHQDHDPDLVVLLDQENQVQGHVVVVVLGQPSRDQDLGQDPEVGVPVLGNLVHVPYLGRGVEAVQARINRGRDQDRVVVAVLDPQNLDLYQDQEVEVQLALQSQDLVVEALLALQSQDLEVEVQLVLQNPDPEVEVQLDLRSLVALNQEVLALLVLLNQGLEVSEKIACPIRC
jgi:hypothetical protein